MKILAVEIDYPYSRVMVIGFSDGHAVCVMEDGKIRLYCKSDLRVIDPEYIPPERRESDGT